MTTVDAFANFIPSLASDLTGPGVLATAHLQLTTVSNISNRGGKKLKFRATHCKQTTAQFLIAVASRGKRNRVRVLRNQFLQPE